MRDITRRTQACMHCEWHCEDERASYLVAAEMLRSSGLRRSLNLTMSSHSGCVSSMRTGGQLTVSANTAGATICVFALSSSSQACLMSGRRASRKWQSCRCASMRCSPSDLLTVSRAC